jgi:hypothetical protein
LNPSDGHEEEDEDEGKMGKVAENRGWQIARREPI